MAGIKALAARIAVLGFAAAAAFYSLSVSSIGKLNVYMGEPEGPVRLLSDLSALNTLLS